MIVYAAVLALLLPREAARLNTAANFSVGALYILLTFAPTHSASKANFDLVGDRSLHLAYELDSPRTIGPTGKVHGGHPARGDLAEQGISAKISAEICAGLLRHLVSELTRATCCSKGSGAGPGLACFRGLAIPAARVYVSGRVNATKKNNRNPERASLARFAWWVLAYNLLVIVWGAFVRASGSGAGCGRHWPLCNGEVVPTPKNIATIIEASHRLTSGIALVLVLALVIGCFRRLAKGDRARRGAALSGVFIVTEALIGAGLVLFELVAHDTSMKRALSMVLHLGNTFLLLASLALTAWWLQRRELARAELSAPDERPAGELAVRGAVVLALGGVLLLAGSGAVAALGDTLFPARSLREGIAQDLSPVAHAFVRLRMLHPLIALASGVVVLTTAAFVRIVRPAPRVRAFSRATTVLFVVQFCAGLLNLTLLAPIAMQLVHLLLADAVWIALVLMSWEAVYGDGAAIMSRKGPAPSSDVPPSTSNVEPVTYAPAGETR
jgi:heme a synthase